MLAIFLPLGIGGRMLNSGIQPLGGVEWGTHFCHFFRDAADLADTLVPYFKSGLEGNECCLWVTAEPFSKEAALARLRESVPNVERRIESGQLEVYDHEEWYERVSRASRSDVVGMWVDAKRRGMQRGFSGLRLSGNTAFLRKEDWTDFRDYETAVRETFGSHEILALCSYQADRWDADAVLDIVQNHDFALSRRRGTWEIVESASVKKSKAALVALNAELEQRVHQRTEALSEALSRQRLLTAELSHRVKNAIAGAQSIVDQTLRRATSLADARKALGGRLHVLGRAHEQLAAADWAGVRLRDLAGASTQAFTQQVRLAIDDEVLTPKAALNLSLILHELMTNAAKYGALTVENGRILIEARALDAGRYRISWTESGGPRVEPPSQEGFGTRLVRALIDHDLRGESELAFKPEGLSCTFIVPWRELVAATNACSHGCAH